MTDSNTACIPTAVPDLQGDARWMSLHERFVAEAKEREADVLFIGDSLIQSLVHFDVWTKLFEPLHCLNFGIGGDQTQHVLWRVSNGELEGISPRIIVLLVGTNNHDHNALQVAEGVMTVVEAIKERQTMAHVVVLALPPRGRRPNRLRDKINEINVKLAAEIGGLSQVTFLNVDSNAWVNDEGEISHLDMYDYLHFTQKGYEKLCEPLAEEIQNILGEFGPK